MMERVVYSAVVHLGSLKLNMARSICEALH